MDFVGITKYDLVASTDPMTGDGVLTVTNPEDNSVIFEIRCEVYKVRPLLDSLSEVARNLYADPAIHHWTRHSIINANKMEATTTLSAPL